MPARTDAAPSPTRAGDLAPYPSWKCTRNTGHNFGHRTTLEEVSGLYHGQTPDAPGSRLFDVQTCHCGVRRVRLPDMPDGRASLVGYLPPASDGDDTCK